jgi:hypothetical protein
MQNIQDKIKEAYRKGKSEGRLTKKMEVLENWGKYKKYTQWAKEQLREADIQYLSLVNSAKSLPIIESFFYDLGYVVESFLIRIPEDLNLIQNL